MPESFIAEYKSEIVEEYRRQKQAADEALARVSDDAFFERLRADGDEHTNSVAILVKHIGGNLRSRWTDFLTTDGEKPDRYREREFMEEQSDSREAIMQRWERGWQVTLDTLASLRDEDFSRTVTIRDEPHSVVRAINRNLTHLALHIGQIDLLATLLQKNSQ
ncbi:MAG: DUF1572 domain-containing protein [Chloroflexi bacterium]|nr:DUF1572 domain-containing protein [Chloroflexota bacterium]